MRRTFSRNETKKSRNKVAPSMYCPSVRLLFGIFPITWKSRWVHSSI